MIRKNCIALTSCLLALGLLHPSTTTADNWNPNFDLPPHIKKLTNFGERPDWSHDNVHVLFLEKYYGDVYRVNIKTGAIEALTHYFPHKGFLRALYLANGDILLTGSRDFDPKNIHDARHRKAELWVLDKSLTKPPTPLGQFLWEGPAVSRHQMHIAWTEFPAPLE